MGSNNFARTLGKSRVEKIEKLFEQAWWCDLIALWKPAGQASGEYGLRLAIRENYVNFYRYGQSVAKVHILQNKPSKLKVNFKYVKPDWRSWYTRNGLSMDAQMYVEISDDNILRTSGKLCEEIGKYEGMNTLKSWIHAVGSHFGKEKRFVDRLIGCNPNVIDVEMALKGFGENKAPRIDLVTIEADSDNAAITFWEAKMMENKEARSEADPKIFGQLEKYKIWIDERRETVARAYKECSEILVAIHSHARGQGFEVQDLGANIVELAKGDVLPLIKESPYVVISDLKKNESWEKNGHHQKLSEKFKVKLVQSEGDDAHRLHA